MKEILLMDDTKLCPYCAEEIKAAAIVCKHCGRELPEFEELKPVTEHSTGLSASQRQQKNINVSSVSDIEDEEAGPFSKKYAISIPQPTLRIRIENYVVTTSIRSKTVSWTIFLEGESEAVDEAIQRVVDWLSEGGRMRYGHAEPYPFGDYSGIGWMFSVNDLDDASVVIAELGKILSKTEGWK